MPPEQILEKTETRLKLGKAKSNRDIDALRIATQVRESYKAGIKGRSNYETHGIPKSRYIDIIGNRTCKEDVIYWK